MTKRLKYTKDILTHVVNNKPGPVMKIDGYNVDAKEKHVPMTATS